MAAVTKIVDDLDQTLDGETHTFEWDGKTYEIDLADKHWDELQTVQTRIAEQKMYLDAFLQVARPANGTPKTRTGAGPGRKTKKTSTPVQRTRNVKKGLSVKASSDVSGKPNPAEVRKWCLDNGVPVSNTGVIQKSAYAAYAEAHKG